MSASSYASVSDLTGTGGYLRDPNVTANTTILTTFLAVVSRLIDEESGQSFYDDGAQTRYVNNRGGSQIDFNNVPFFASSGTIDAASQGATTLQYTPSFFAPRAPIANEAVVVDVGAKREVVIPSVVGTISSGKYPLTVSATSFQHAQSAVATTFQITVAYFENMPLAQWIQELDGDGYTPPSNWYLWPNVPRRVGSATDNSAMKPWYAIDLPMIPISNTTWLPTTMIGKATVGLTAHWGWPVIPDLIKDLTCRGTSILWRKRQAGQGDSGSGAAIGTAALGEVRALIKAELKDSIYKAVYI